MTSICLRLCSLFTFTFTFLLLLLLLLPPLLPPLRLGSVFSFSFSFFRLPLASVFFFFFFFSVCTGTSLPTYLDCSCCPRCCEANDITMYLAWCGYLMSRIVFCLFNEPESLRPPLSLSLLLQTYIIKVRRFTHTDQTQTSSRQQGILALPPSMRMAI
ncbi:uncharacterized protein LY79DRAFT_334403 [Colletotrichum navitas]|uniref:Uncharacterized protein n=1 Tax=Colletotrichum navitas TaxID=681940 RepID=A0AAD8PT51_9PEZI|nr:uncharacterized protein LY79DRAFT_334403 [Colletotrichum navitas]KAK1579762.1 hypothetical protein LY79DRAFT_334403 [Colletotrichum navitas]